MRVDSLTGPEGFELSGFLRYEVLGQSLQAPCLRLELPEHRPPLVTIQEHEQPPEERSRDFHKPFPLRRDEGVGRVALYDERSPLRAVHVRASMHERGYARCCMKYPGEAPHRTAAACLDGG